MSQLSFLLALGALVSAAPGARFAVLVEDPEEGTPTRTALESALQRRGYEVVDAKTSARLRKLTISEGGLHRPLIDGPSVYETDAVLAGTATYAAPAPVDEGVFNHTVMVTLRLIDLATGRTTATTRAHGVALGAIRSTGRAQAAGRAALQALGRPEMAAALGVVGPTGGAVTLVVRGVPSREALSALRERLEAALAGAPAKEIYFATGVGKLVLGGARSPTAMNGPDIADALTNNRDLGLVVVEVANTRIVARFDRSRAVRVHALVLEPQLGPQRRRQATQLGKFLATQLATYDFARATYQRGRLSRKRALRRAKRVGANVVVESEVLTVGRSSAMVMRIVDVASGRPIFRTQRVLSGLSPGLEVAQALLSDLERDLPSRLLAGQRPSSPPSPYPSTPTAAGEPAAPPR